MTSMVTGLTEMVFGDEATSTAAGAEDSNH